MCSNEQNILQGFLDVLSRNSCLGSLQIQGGHILSCYQFVSAAPQALLPIKLKSQFNEFHSPYEMTFKFPVYASLLTIIERKDTHHDTRSVSRIY